MQLIDFWPGWKAWKSVYFLGHVLLVGLAINQKRLVKAYEILGSALDPSAQVTKNILTVKELLSPLSREQVGLVRCLGLNYADHAVRRMSNSSLPKLRGCMPG